MSEFLLPGMVSAESEFTAGSGACGPTALAAAMRWSKQDNTITAQKVMQQMITWNLCDNNGVTTTPNLRNAAAKYNMQIQNPATGEDKIHFGGRAIQAVQGTLLGAVIFEVTNGQVLQDYLTGIGEDASNLHNHFFTLAGYNSGGFSPYLGCSVPQGFFVCDGDNYVQNPLVNGNRIHRALNNDLVYYPLSLLQSALPFDAFSVVRVNLDALTIAQNRLARIAKDLTS